MWRRSGMLVVMLIAAAPCAPALAVPTEGLKFWLDADRIAGIDGAPVAAWEDASGSGNHAAQGYAPYQPVLREGVLNGHAVVRYGEAGALTTLLTPSISMSTRSYFIVVTRRGDPVGDVNTFVMQNVYPFYQAYGPATWYAQYGWDHDIRYYDGGYHTTGIPYEGTGTMLYEVEVSDNMTRLFVDGQLRREYAWTPSLLNAPFEIGGYAPHYCLNGDLAEVLVYDRALGEAQRQSVGWYLDQKYGLDTVYTPEPATLALLAAGLAGLIRRRMAHAA